MSKVVISKEDCVSCGICVDTCPEVFEIGSDDVVKIKNGVEVNVSDEKVKSAIIDCPTEAIKIEQ